MNDAGVTKDTNTDRINAGEYAAEELEDWLAAARHWAHRRSGYVTLVPHAEARQRLGLDSTR